MRKAQSAKIRLSSLTREENEKENLRPRGSSSNKVNREDLRKDIAKQRLMSREIQKIEMEQGLQEQTEINRVSNLISKLNLCEDFRKQVDSLEIISERYEKIKDALNERSSFKLLKKFSDLNRKVIDLQEKLDKHVFDELLKKFEISKDCIKRLGSLDLDVEQVKKKGRGMSFWSTQKYKGSDENLAKVISEAERLIAWFEGLKKDCDKLKSSLFNLIVIGKKEREYIEKNENALKQGIASAKIQEAIALISKYDYSASKYADFTKDISKRYEEIETLLGKNCIEKPKSFFVLTRKLRELQIEIHNQIFKKCFPPEKELLEDYKLLTEDLPLLKKDENRFWSQDVYRNLREDKNQEQALLELIGWAERVNKQYREANDKFYGELKKLSLNLIKDHVDKVEKVSKSKSTLELVINDVKSKYPNLFYNKAADGSQKESELSDEKENIENKFN